MSNFLRVSKVGAINLVKGMLIVEIVLPTKNTHFYGVVNCLSTLNCVYKCN